MIEKNVKRENKGLREKNKRFKSEGGTYRVTGKNKRCS